MATRIVVCPECGVPVPYGRLSCPECGSLLASVVGYTRRVTPITEAELPVAQPSYAAPPPFPLPATPPPLPPITPPSPAQATPAPTLAQSRPTEAARPASRPTPTPKPASSPPRSTQPRRVQAPASPPPTASIPSTAAEVLGATPAAVAPAPAETAAVASRAAARRRPTRIEDPAPPAPEEPARPEPKLPLGRWDLGAALPSVSEVEVPETPAISASAPLPPPIVSPPAMPEPPPPVTPAMPPAAAPARPTTRAPRLSPAYAASVTPPQPPPLTSPPLNLGGMPPPAPRAPMTKPISASLTPPAAPFATTPLPGAEPTWPTNAAMPVVTPRRAPERTRTNKPLNGKPTNGAAAVALPTPAVGGPPVPIWPPEPAGEPLPPSAVFAGAPDVDDLLGATPATSSTMAAESPRPASLVAPARMKRPRLPKLADLEIDLPDNVADTLVTIGSGVALVGFLLPWSDAVVGARSFGGYTDSWGLAVPSHLLVMLLLGAVLTLAVMPNRVPSWIRTGVLGMLVGGLLVGLAWPYLVGGLGFSLGILFEAVAAILLVAGGVADRRAARH